MVVSAAPGPADVPRAVAGLIGRVPVPVPVPLPVLVPVAEPARGGRPVGPVGEVPVRGRESLTA
ncbi:hypothetical protein ACGFXC_19290 [Streptomyces sp. NPDC048507]|uniref:hypothetical protein n=1 Tax=Streptomyces sp. NPDC048507 TaxID=3365560 RepID=UPI003717D03C